MKKAAFIDPERCDGSPMCPAKRMCPQKAISQNGGGFFGGGTAVVDRSKCTGCGICTDYCPHGAVKMVRV